MLCFQHSKIRQYRRFSLKFADFANSRGSKSRKLAFGDLSPAQIFHRQREAQNRGFGDISPEMATLTAVPTTDGRPTAPLPAPSVGCFRVQSIKQTKKLN